MKNALLYLISAVIAVLLFVFVHSQRNAIQRVLVMPVDVQNLPRDKVILLPTVRQVQVIIQGPAFLVAEASTAAHSVKVDLPENVGGSYWITFDERKLSLPPAIKVVRIEPSSMQLILDRRIQRRLPVVVPRIGKFKDSVKLMSFKIEPSEILVSGPETEVKGITHVETLPLDLRDLEGQVQRTLPIRGNWQYSEVDVNSVNVTVDLVPIVRKRQFEQVPIEIRSRTPREVRLDPDQVRVEISGLSDVIERLTPQDIVAYVKLGEAGSAAAEVSVELPQGVTLIGVEPQTVGVLYAAEVEKATGEHPAEGDVHGAEK